MIDRLLIRYDDVRRAIGERAMMRPYTEYWIAMMVRGTIALLAATAGLAVSGIAATILLLPLAIVISILCLAAYGVLDSAIAIVSSFMVPSNRPGRMALRLQGIAGVVIGVLMFSVVNDRVRLPWFLYLAALQAATVAVAEVIAARGTADHHESNWCYVSASIAALSAVVLLSVGNLGHREMAWVIYGYLGLFGLNLIALSAKMLFARNSHELALKSSKSSFHGLN